MLLHVFAFTHSGVRAISGSAQFRNGHDSVELRDGFQDLPSQDSGVG
jgi:hypothetical protein